MRQGDGARDRAPHAALDWDRRAGDLVRNLPALAEKETMRTDENRPKANEATFLTPKLPALVEHGLTYDVHPEKALAHLDQIENTFTGMSVQMNLAAAQKHADVLLGKVARLRTTMDKLQSTANEKEEELQKLSVQIDIAEKRGESLYMGQRGEHTLDKKREKLLSERGKFQEKVNQAEVFGRIYRHMIERLRKEDINSRRNKHSCEAEIRALNKQIAHARQERLARYQEMAREKRNLDLLEEKSKALTLLEEKKLDEAELFLGRQQRKYDKVKERTEQRRRKMLALLGERERRKSQQLALAHMQVANKSDIVAAQLAPLEDVFYKIRVRTGKMHFDADQIAQVFINQQTTGDSLRAMVHDAQEKIERLKSWQESHRDDLKTLNEHKGDLNSKKTFYKQLDIADRKFSEISMELERKRDHLVKVKMLLESSKTFLRETGKVLGTLQIDGVRSLQEDTIRASLKEGNFKMALLEVSHHLMGLAREAKEMHDAKKRSKLLARAKSRRQHSTATLHGDAHDSVPRDIGGGDAMSRDSSMQSFASFESHGSRRRQSALFAIDDPRTVSLGNIRVARQVACVENGYNSDAEGHFSKASSERSQSNASIEGSKAEDDEELDTYSQRHQIKMGAAELLGRGKRRMTRHFRRKHQGVVVEDGEDRPQLPQPPPRKMKRKTRAGGNKGRRRTSVSKLQNGMENLGGTPPRHHKGSAPGPRSRRKSIAKKHHVVREAKRV
eukprot:g1797.t1